MMVQWKLDEYGSKQMIGSKVVKNGAEPSKNAIIWKLVANGYGLVENKAYDDLLLLET